MFSFFDAFFSGQLNNLYLMGIPDEFCLSEMFRADLKICHTCEPIRRTECEKGYEGEGKAWTVHYCVKPLSELYQMSPYAPRGWDKNKKIQISLSQAKWLNNRTSLHDVATFAWFVRSKIYSDNTPYFTVSFTANNHGSWIDIIAQATSSKMGKRGLKSEANHHSETVLSTLPKSSSFKKVPHGLEYVLWLHADDVKEEFNVELVLHTYFDISVTFLIHRVVWHGLVTFYQENPTFCLSTPGRAFQGHVRFCGKRSFSINFVPNEQICSVFHHDDEEEVISSANKRQKTSNFCCWVSRKNSETPFRKFDDAQENYFVPHHLGIFYSIFLL